MRGEASDFAAMRDAFRNAGLCTEATPAALVESWCARRDDSDGEDSLYVPSPQRVKIRRRLAEACVASPRFVRRAAEAGQDVRAARLGSPPLVSVAHSDVHPGTLTPL